MEPYRYGLWPCALKIDWCWERMLKEWKISAIARVMNAMVIPSRLSTISQRPDST